MTKDFSFFTFYHMLFNRTNGMGLLKLPVSRLIIALQLVFFIALLFILQNNSFLFAHSDPSKNSESHKIRFEWTSLQAEDGQTNAQKIGPSVEVGDPAAECVGRQGVRLARSGDFVEWKSPCRANSIVVRQSIPDAPKGGGIERSLSLYVNGGRVGKLLLSSVHSWLYGNEEYPVNDPSAGSKPRRMFDESRLLVKDFPAGATVRIQKDPDDTAEWAIIDLIDLELVKPALTQPANSVSITDFGAIANDEIDDTSAIQKCIRDCEETGKIVFIPNGTFLISGEIFIRKPVTIRGAGMWYSTLKHSRADMKNWKKTGFLLFNKTVMSDLFYDGGSTIRNEDRSFLIGTFSVGSVIERVWVEHAQVGAWVGWDYKTPPDGLRVSHCRFRDLFADGINLCSGTQNSIVEYCHARNTGDDSFASWSVSKSLNGVPCRNNLFIHCMAEAPWRARCFALFGGENNRIENCYGCDTLVDSGINISTQFSPRPFAGTTVIKNVTLERCGGYYFKNRPYGAVLLQAKNDDYHGKIVFDGLTVKDSIFSAVMVQSGPKKVANVEIKNSLFTAVERWGIFVDKKCFGDLSIKDCIFKTGKKPLLENLSTETFKVDLKP